MIMIITQLSSVFSNHSTGVAARALYIAASQVFKSLPSIEMVENFTQAEYDAWYTTNFSDSVADSGAMLVRNTLDESGNVMVFVTPTSGREIWLFIGSDGAIDNTEIKFVGRGSKNAASEIARLTRIALEASAEVDLSHRTLHIEAEGWHEGTHDYIVEGDFLAHSFAEGEEGYWYHDSEMGHVYQTA